MSYKLPKTLTLLFLFFSFFLFSCSINNKDIAVKSDNAIISEENKKDISPIASEDWFKNDIHLLSNPSNRSYILVKGDGTIVLSTYDPNLENIGKIEDVSGTTNYIYKTYTGENYIKFNISNTDEEYFDARPTEKCVVYDKNGNEIGFEADTYSPSYSSINKIIYRLNNDDGSGEYFTFDVKTKENKKIDYEEIATMNGRFIMGTSPWGENEKEEVVVCDENLNEVKKIDGYSFDGVNKIEGKEFATLRKKTSEGSDSKYNFLDSNFEIIFENDVDERIWTGNSSVLTLRTGNTVIDYDFINNVKVGAEREYNSISDNMAKRKLEEEKNAAMEEKIQNENKVNGEDKYSYVYSFVSGDKVLFLAHKNSNIGMFDGDAIDVYNEDGKIIAEFEDLSSYYSDEGYLFVNHETVYNMDLQIVKTLKEKRNIERVTKFGKTFFYDRTGLDYSSVKPFTLYDSAFEPIFENLECIEMDSYDDYIVIVDNEATKFLDKDLKVVRTIDRKIDIRSWYSNKSGFKAFEDLENERMGIIDKNFKIVVDKKKHVGSLEEKYFTYQNGFEYGLMDYEGRPILKYSIFDTMREDSRGEDFRGNYVVQYDDYD